MCLAETAPLTVMVNETKLAAVKATEETLQTLNSPFSVRMRPVVASHCIYRHWQEYVPSSPIRQAPPEGVSADLLLNQLLPEHTIADDPLPLLTHELGGAERAVVQVGEDVLRHVIQALVWGGGGRSQKRDFIM